MLMLALAAATLAAAPSCPAERGQYRLRGAPEVTAGFARLPHPVNSATDLLFWVRTPEGRRWWFEMHAPNGYGGVRLVPSADADAHLAAEQSDEAGSPPADDPPEVDFDAFDRNYDVLADPPTSGAPAPAHLFARGLGPLLWYDPITAAHGDQSATPVSIPIAMYDLIGCSAKG